MRGRKPDATASVEWQRVGNYSLIRSLGNGGMAHVYEAFNDQIGKRVAIKILRPELPGRDELEQRFLNEARAVNLVQHPGLVSIFEFGRTAEGCLYIVMEYLDGVPLTAYIRQNHPLSVRKCLYLTRQIASALASAHAAGVVHRDLKPDNIIVIKDPEVPGEERTKLIDFGIAKMEVAKWVGSKLNAPFRTQTGVVLGTPAYMAPEQESEPGAVNDRADVYSLGRILYQLLGRQLPSIKPDPEEDGSEPTTASQRLRKLNPAVPEPVALLVEEMLSQKPEARPAMRAVTARLTPLIRSMDNTDSGAEPESLTPLDVHSYTSPPLTIPSSLAVMLPASRSGAAGDPEHWLFFIAIRVLRYCAKIIKNLENHLTHNVDGRPEGRQHAIDWSAPSTADAWLRPLPAPLLTTAPLGYQPAVVAPLPQAPGQGLESAGHTMSRRQPSMWGGIVITGILFLAGSGLGIAAQAGASYLQHTAYVSVSQSPDVAKTQYLNRNLALSADFFWAMAAAALMLTLMRAFVIKARGTSCLLMLFGLAAATLLTACSPDAVSMLRGAIGSSCVTDADCQAARCVPPKPPKVPIGGNPSASSMVKGNICAKDCTQDTDCPTGSKCAGQLCQIPLKVGVALTGAADDEGWTAAHRMGIETAAAELGYVELDLQFSLPPGHVAGPVAELASRDDLILGNTVDYIGDFKKAAAEHPEKQFACIDDGVYRHGTSNFTTYWIDRTEGWYMAGQLAAKVAKKRLGVISAFINPETVQEVNAFTLGARSINHDIQVEVRYIGFWFDNSIAQMYTYTHKNGMVAQYYREEYLAALMIDSGCEVIAHLGNTQRSVRLIAKLRASGLALSTQYSYANDKKDACSKDSSKVTGCLGSIYENWYWLYYDMFEGIHRHTFQAGKPFIQDLASDKDLTPTGVSITEEIITDPVTRSQIQGALYQQKDTKQFVFHGPYRITGQRDKDNDGIPDANQVVAKDEDLKPSEINRMCWYVEGVIEKSDLTKPASADKPALVPGGLVPGAKQHFTRQGYPGNDKLFVPQDLTASCLDNAIGEL